jgi:DNA invertase Pin-like site-specific DNA recombinase
MTIPSYPGDKNFQKYKDGMYAVHYVPADRLDSRPPACALLRVSGRKQSEEDKHSLPEQWRLNWEDAERRGFRIVAVYIDVLSGAERSRKAFQQMLADGRNGLYRAIFATMNDRLFRNMWSAADLEELVEQHTIELYGTAEPIDKELLGLFAWVASRERKNIIKRTVMGREAVARNNGIPSGKPPFYLKVIHDERGKPHHIELDEYYAPIIRERCVRYADGEPLRSIMRDLLKDVPRPKGKTKYGWTPQYLNQILRSTTLYGKWPFKQYFIDVPALVDRNMWDRVQFSMQERRRGSEGGRPARIPAPLAKLMYCAVCGKVMNSHVRDWDYTYKRLADGTKARYRVKHGKIKIKYVCGGMNHYPDVHQCRQPEYVRNEDIFPKVWNKLYNGLAHPERITVGIRKVLEQLEHSDEQADLATIEKRLAKIEQKMLSYADQRAEGVITPEQQRELTTRLQDEKDALLAEKAKLTSKTERIREALQMLAYVEPVAKKMAGKMKDLTDEERIIFIRAACGRIWIDANNEIEIELSLPGLEAFAKREGDNEDASESDNSSSLPPQSEPSDGFHEGAGGTTNAERHWDLPHKVRCTRNTDCRRS